MASVRIPVRICDRCLMGKEKPATTKRTFAIEDRYSEIDLCDQHADAFDRDIGQWIQLATDIENPYDRAGRSTTFTRERAEDAKRVIEQSAALQRQHEQSVLEAERAKAMIKKAEEDAFKAIPGAMKWTLTRHARQRMMERGFTPTEVLMAVTVGNIVKQPWRGPAVEVHSRAGCRVVVETRTHQIVTVIERDTALETAETARLLASVN